VHYFINTTIVQTVATVVYDVTQYGNVSRVTNTRTVTNNITSTINVTELVPTGNQVGGGPYEGVSTVELVSGGKMTFTTWAGANTTVVL